MVRERALQLYRDGLGCKLVARRTGVSYATVARWARRSGILRTRKQAGLVKAEAHPIHWGDLNPERAWVLGLIYGNGGIKANGSYVSLDAENCDIDVLHKAKAILRHGSDPFPRGGDHRVTFCSRRFVADLKREFDLDEDKCSRMPWPALVDDLLPHFVRGLLDSDGSWCSAESLLVFSYSSASRSFIEHLEAALFRHVNVCSRTIQERPARERRMGERIIRGAVQFRVEYGHFDSVELGQWIYAGSTEHTRGGRKHEKWAALSSLQRPSWTVLRHERHKEQSRANRIANEASTGVRY